MNIYRLHLETAFIDPRWLSRIHGRYNVTVADDGTVEIEGKKLRFEKPEETPGNGTAMIVWLNRWFYCCTAEEEAAENARREAEETERKHRKRERMNAARDEAQAYNTAIHLPVKWDVGIKDVLSGLSARSDGTGRNRATVEHILLLESLTAGKLKRAAGDFLCTSKTGTNGKNWSDNKIERWIDGDGHECQPMPSCKQCRKLLEQFRKGANS